MWAKAKGMCPCIVNLACDGLIGVRNMLKCYSAIVADTLAMQELCESKGFASLLVIWVDEGAKGVKKKHWPCMNTQVKSLRRVSTDIPD